MTKQRLNWESFPEYMFVEEVAAILRLSERTVRQRCKDGIFPHHKEGTRILIDKNILRKIITDSQLSSMNQVERVTNA